MKRSPLALLPLPFLALTASGAAAQVLEEVVVTAQKREQSMQDVPISVSAVSGAELAARNINEVADLARVVPGFSFGENTSDAGKTILIRGVGTQTFSRGVEQSVGTVVDGVVSSAAAASLLDMSDVARVEVLRGPQGMLFGKNASAGLLNITTNAPENTFGAGLGLSFAEENEQKLNGYVTGPVVGDAVLGRLSFYSNKRDPMLENDLPGGPDYNDRDEWGARGKLRFDMTDNLDLQLGWNHAERDHRCCTSANFSVVEGSLADQLEVPSGPENDHILENDDATGSTELDVYSAEFNYSVGDYTLTSISAYTQTDIASNVRRDGTPRTALPINAGDSSVDQFTQELRLTSPAGETLEYVAGLYYYHREQERYFERIIDLYGIGAVPAPGLVQTSLINDFDLENESIAAFGQMTWHVDDALRLSLGARYNHEEVEMAQLIGALPGYIPEAPLGEVVAEDTDDALSWRIIGEYDVATDAMVYASIARGYKSPGANTLPSGASSAEPIVAPEIPTNYEIGLKSEWWERRLRLNGAVFYTTFEDFQTSVSNGQVPPTFFLDNAGELETRGVELEILAQVTGQLTLSGGLAYTDSTFTDYTGAACYPGQTEVQGCIDGSQDLGGARMPNSPEKSLTVAGRYDIPMGSLPFDGFVKASWYWQDEVQYDVRNGPTTIGDAYGVADLAFGLEARDGRYAVQVFAKNLFDEFFVTRLADGSELTGGNGHFLDYTYTRRVGIAAQVNF